MARKTPRERYLIRLGLRVARPEHRATADLEASSV